MKHILSPCTISYSLNIRFPLPHRTSGGKACNDGILMHQDVRNALWPLKQNVLCKDALGPLGPHFTYHGCSSDTKKKGTCENDKVLVSFVESMRESVSK